MLSAGFLRGRREGVPRLESGQQDQLFKPSRKHGKPEWNLQASSLTSAEEGSNSLPQPFRVQRTILERVEREVSLEEEWVVLERRRRRGGWREGGSR